jgi:hypothetical protein
MQSAAGAQAVPKAREFNEEVLLPAAKYISAELQAQAYEIAAQVPPGAARLPFCI